MNLPSGSDGFTLLELLVAITIFSLVIGMAMFSLRFSFGIFRHLDAPFAEETQQISRLRDCIASTFNYVVSKKDMFNQNKGFYTFFTGEPEQVTFISGKPSSGTGMAVCRLSLNNGNVVLDETPLYGKESNYQAPALLDSQKTSTVIIPEVTSLRLEYLHDEKMLSSLKEIIPSMIRIVIVSGGREREYYCRIPVNFDDKAQYIKSLYEPI